MSDTHLDAGPTSGGPEWPDPERVSVVRAASAAWPSVELSATQVDDLELVLDGLLDPQVLAVPGDTAADRGPGTHVALRDPEGTMVAALEVTSVSPGTDGTVLVDGHLEGIARPPRWTFRDLRPSPARLREQLAVHERVLAVVTDRALHREDVEHLRDEVGRARAHLLLVQLERGEAGADTTAAVTRALATVLPDLRVPTTLALLPSSARLEGDDRDERLDALAATLGADRRIRLGRLGGDIDAALRAGDTVATDATFAPVAEQLRAAHPPRHARGVVVLFTGLSGSGKSTIANALRGRLLERGDHRVTLLDGDLVRKHLSKGLGFSREDRATNVRRIGFVAAEIARHGGVAICAPIAPDATVRDEVAAMARKAGAGFVLVHVATPLEVCEARDRKGLYAKARAGLLPGFTGIDDPYDVPESPDLRLDTSDAEVQDGARQVLGLLAAEGWLAPER